MNFMILFAIIALGVYEDPAQFEKHVTLKVIDANTISFVNDQRTPFLIRFADKNGEYLGFSQLIGKHSQLVQRGNWDIQSLKFAVCPTDYEPMDTSTKKRWTISTTEYVCFQTKNIER